MTLSASGVGTASPAAQVTSFNVSISATGGAGRIVLVIGMESDSTTAVTVATITGLSAAWTKRTAKQQLSSTSNIPENCEVWYADFAASTSGTVTVNTSAAGVDSGSCIAVFVSSSIGAAIAWDTNGSLPALLGGRTNAGGTASVSTTSTAPYVLVIYASSHSPLSSGPTPVSTSLGSVSNNVTNLAQYSIVEGGTPGQLSSTSAGFGTVDGTTTNQSAWVVIVDALTEVASGNTDSMFAVMGP